MMKKILSLLVFSVYCGCIVSMLWLIVTMNFKNEKSLEIKKTQITDTIPAIQEVTGTKFNPVASQTDEHPLITADGSVIDTYKLSQGQIRWCALSRDLLSFNGGPYSYGDSIFAFNSNDSITGWWIVHDTMHKRYCRRIDFLQSEGDESISGHTEHILISKTKFYE